MESNYENTFKIPLTKSRSARVQQIKNERRCTRGELYNRGRNIEEDLETEIDREKPKIPTPKVVKNPAVERMERLKKFKEEKKIRLELQRKNTKPAFRTGMTHGCDVLKTIPTCHNKAFAHVSSKIDTGRVTRSMAKKNNVPLIQGLNNTNQKKKFVPPKNIVNIPIPKVENNEPIDLKKIFANQKKPTLKNENIFVENPPAMAIIKPFHAGYQQEADDFEMKLNKEIKRLLSQSEDWEKLKETDPSIPGEILDDIDTAIGQTRLLVSKKFEQFRGLINQCRRNEDRQKVTPEDLQGFWDMMYMQVENIDTRFVNLQNLKSKNWVVEEKKPITILRKKVNVKPEVKAVEANPSSKPTNFKAYIEAIRKKKLERIKTTGDCSIIDNSVVIFDPKENNSVINTPIRSRDITRKINTPIASPGLKMMRASILGKITSP